MIKPWMVAATLTLVAASGATAVYYGAQAQHRRDRNDILRWEARALPAAHDAEARVQALRATLRSADIARVRAALGNDLEAITRAPLPEIVRPPAAAYVEALKRSEAVLEAIGTASFEAALTRAKAAFVAARSAVQTLDCKGRLPACSNP